MEGGRQCIFRNDFKVGVSESLKTENQYVSFEQTEVLKYTVRTVYGSFLKLAIRVYFSELIYTDQQISDIAWVFQHQKKF